MNEQKNIVDPIRLALFSKAASEIMIILSRACPDITYKDCRYILDMVYSDVSLAEYKAGKGN